MSFQKKYYFDFYRLNTTEKHTVEIWQDTSDALTAQEITGIQSPFIVEMPELQSKFQVVRGKGCSLTLVSETDGQFFDSLYHINPTEIKLIHKINDTVESIFYLDSEMMQEPYSESFNYPVSVTGNDGLALMDRFSFIQVDGTNYSGIRSKIELLQIILNKLNLWESIGIELATGFTGTESGYYLLQNSYIDCSNFYDEDDKPMSLREVADSLLAPYGAHMEAKGSKILISDIHTKAVNVNMNYLLISLADLSTDGVYTIYDNLRAITADSYMGTGSDKERSGGVNRQVVAYSPFTRKEMLESSLIGVSEFTTVPETWSIKDGYKYKVLSGNESWEIDFAHSVTLPPSGFEASYYQDEKNTSVYIRRPTYTNDESTVARLKQGPQVSITGINVGITDRNGNIRTRNTYTKGVAFLITGVVLPKIDANPYLDGDSIATITSIQIGVRVKVGDKYYHSSDGTWKTESSWFYINTLNQSLSISDKWTDINYKLPIAGIDNEFVLNGELEFELLTSFRTTHTQSLVTTYENDIDVKEIWYKDISVKLVNQDGSEVSDEDVEYIGILDKNFQNEGEKITLTCGTDARYCDRGKIMRLDGTEYSAIREWTRNDQTFKIEELLLNSLCSNYKSGYITLSNMKLKADFPLHTIFTDECLPGVKLMIKQAKINYEDNLCECTLVEISPDELIIEK